MTAPEFGAAAASMPIIFAGEERSPLAVMGIRSGENLFVKNGQYEVDFYMPAFGRRYPFVLAGDNANDRFVVCVDEKAECVTDKNPEQMFFDKDDTSQFTKEAFQFLQSFERDRQATQKMVEEFKALDLFEPKEMNFQGNNADGTPAPRQKIADYFAVSEEKLKALPEAKIAEMSKNGYLANRRTLLQSASAIGALGLIGCKPTPTKPTISKAADDAAQSVLDEAKNFMLNSYPETASSMGIDKGDYAGLRAKLSDRSPDGQAAIATQTRALNAKLEAIDTQALSPDLGLDVDVVAATFERSAAGFDFPYGDMALLNSNLSYRPSPYVVAQNTGAFIEIPSFLGASQKPNRKRVCGHALTETPIMIGRLARPRQQI